MHRIAAAAGIALTTVVALGPAHALEWPEGQQTPSAPLKEWIAQKGDGFDFKSPPGWKLKKEKPTSWACGSQFHVCVLMTSSVDVTRDQYADILKKKGVTQLMRGQLGGDPVLAWVSTLGGMPWANVWRWHGTTIFQLGYMGDPPPDDFWILLATLKFNG